MFIMEVRRHQYLRAPQGFLASGDAYNKRMDDITAGVQNKIEIIDDTMLWEGSREECFFATCKYVDLYVRNGVVFNPNKIRFGKREVDFAAFAITDKAGKPTMKMIETIANFLRPVNLTGAFFPPSYRSILCRFVIGGRHESWRGSVCLYRQSL